ncbi:LytTR family transcriptional regulator [Pseudomonas aeruginosa]|nr:LytTR family transcriptional regulator [Pseudomonas aeruginosa]
MKKTITFGCLSNRWICRATPKKLHKIIEKKQSKHDKNHKSKQSKEKIMKKTAPLKKIESGIEKITHFLAEERHIFAYTADEKILIKTPLSHLEKYFEEIFIRTHRKALVRKSLLSIYKANHHASKSGLVLIFNTEHWIPVSRENHERVMLAMGLSNSLTTYSNNPTTAISTYHAKVGTQLTT